MRQAALATSVQRKHPWRAIIVLGVIVAIVVAIVVGVVKANNDLKDDPALASSARSALAADTIIGPYVDTVYAEADGTVLVSLNQTSAAMAGASGVNGAARIGAYVNTVVLRAVPAAKKVTTFDADNKILEMTSRN